MLNATIPKSSNDLPDLGSDRSMQLDRSAKHAVDRHHDHGMSLEVGLLHGLLNVGSQCHTL